MARRRRCGEQANISAAPVGRIINAHAPGVNVFNVASFAGSGGVGLLKMKHGAARKAVSGSEHELAGIQPGGDDGRALARTWHLGMSVYAGQLAVFVPRAYRHRLMPVKQRVIRRCTLLFLVGNFVG